VRLVDSGTLYIISAPSGAGKTSLVRALVRDAPDVVLSVSHTTRAPRPGEREGVDYHFVSTGEFSSIVDQGGFLEHARVFDHLYGTARLGVEQHIAQGRDVLLEIDWQGARQVRAALDGCESIFVLPPSLSALKERLRARGQDSQKVIERRMRSAVEQMGHHDEFCYLVVNDDFSSALEQLRTILLARRLRRDRQRQRLAGLISELLAAAPHFP
jgi:guanylate kinase